MMDLFLINTQLLSSQDVNWWTGVVWITCGLLWCFYQLFGLSFWRHPFTAEDPLVSRWCNATFYQIWWRNKFIYILDGLRVITFSANLNFWVNYSFKWFDTLGRCSLGVFVPAGLWVRRSGSRDGWGRDGSWKSHGRWVPNHPDISTQWVCGKRLLGWTGLLECLLEIWWTELITHSKIKVLYWLYEEPLTPMETSHYKKGSL